MPQQCKHVPKELRRYLRAEYDARRISRNQMQETYGLTKYACEKVISKLYRWDRHNVPSEIIDKYCDLYKRKEITRGGIVDEIKEKYGNINTNKIGTWLRQRNIEVWDKIYSSRGSGGDKGWKFTPFEEGVKLHNQKRYEELIASYNKIVIKEDVDEIPLHSGRIRKRNKEDEYD